MPSLLSERGIYPAGRWLQSNIPELRTLPPPVTFLRTEIRAPDGAECRVFPMNAPPNPYAIKGFTNSPAMSVKR